MPRMTDPADPADLIAIARRWLAAFERADLDGLLALYAEDAVHTSPKIRARNPNSGGVLRGKPALRAWWADAFARLPGLRYREQTLTADGADVRYPPKCGFTTRRRGKSVSTRRKPFA